MGRLDDRTAIITGGSSGIGFAIAHELVAEGARVIITGRRRDDLEAAQHRLGESASAVVGDVADLGDLDRVMAEAERRLGHLDIVVANAGVNELGTFGEIGEQAFDRLFAVNAKGLFFSVQKALPLLVDGGSIVIIGSTASSRVMDGHAVYAGTKGAARSFARNWAMDLRHRRIRVNVLSPGPTRTSMLETLGLSAEQLAGLDGAIAELIPFGRWGTPEEVAKAARFLASDDSSFITGAELVVDGGLAQL